MNNNVIYEHYTAGIYFFVPYGESQVFHIDYGGLITDNLKSNIVAQNIQLSNLKVTFYPVGNKAHQNVIFYKDGEVERWNAIAKGENTNREKEYLVNAPSGKLTIAWDRSDNEDKWQITFRVDIIFVQKMNIYRLQIFPFSSSNPQNDLFHKDMDKDLRGSKKIVSDSNQNPFPNQRYEEDNKKEESDDSEIEEKYDVDSQDEEIKQIDLSLRKQDSMILTKRVNNSVIGTSKK